MAKSAARAPQRSSKTEERIRTGSCVDPTAFRGKLKGARRSKGNPQRGGYRCCLGRMRTARTQSAQDTMPLRETPILLRKRLRGCNPLCARGRRDPRPARSVSVFVQPRCLDHTETEPSWRRKRERYAPARGSRAKTHVPGTATMPKNRSPWRFNYCLLGQRGSLAKPILRTEEPSPSPLLFDLAIN